MNIIEQTQKLCEDISKIEDDMEKVLTINAVKEMLHEISPMKDEPVDCVLWVPGSTVVANDYNPNRVAPPEMRLLQLSIESDGFTQPIVTYPIDDHREVVDGFHRNLVGKKRALKKKLHGFLPVTTIRAEQQSKDARIASTIRHNRARGKHQVENMSEIVVELARRNWSDKRIARELGMDPDEVLRLKQISGLAEMFADKEFSEAWRVEWETETE